MPRRRVAIHDRFLSPMTVPEFDQSFVAQNARGRKQKGGGRRKVRARRQRGAGTGLAVWGDVANPHTSQYINHLQRNAPMAPAYPQVSVLPYIPISVGTLRGSLSYDDWKPYSETQRYYARPYEKPYAREVKLAAIRI